MKLQGNINLNDLLHLFNRSCRTVSGFHISLATLLGVAGLVFAKAKLGNICNFHWLPNTPNPDQNLLFVPGLQNLANNCFLNVILQALASCSCFQSFVQQSIEECERSRADEDLLDSLPLAVALDTLLEELCVVDEGRVVLSPQRVMRSMTNYIPSFNLTAQQDAAEAFLHLLSSLREEFAGCYDPGPHSLLELCSSNCRIINPNREERLKDLSDRERWQKSCIGPFDGILRSILSCQTCSSQISLNFEAFHSLPLSPILVNGSSIISRCSLEDCLKKFTVAERVENYHCTNCWHIAGIKYLSSIEANEAEIEKLRTCSKHDLCDCRRTYGHDTFPWANKFSYTLKQISIARSPKILCIQLKRVSMNMFGDLVKLQGHISFPLILDFFPFVRSGVAIKTQEETLHRFVQRRYPQLNFHAENFSSQYETRNSDDVLRVAQDLSVKSNSNEDIDSPKALFTDMTMQSTEQADGNSQLAISSNSYLYRLVSVVEHFGRAGSGHYTVHRRARIESCENKLANQSEPHSACWFCISDSEVHLVSEKDVLAAEASMLFYEKILEI